MKKRLIFEIIILGSLLGFLVFADPANETAIEDVNHVPVLLGNFGGETRMIRALDSTAAGDSAYKLGVASEIVDFDIDTGDDLTGAAGILGGSTAGAKPVAVDPDGHLMVDVDGVYNASTNADPDNVGLIVHTNAATPADTQQVERVTGGDSTATIVSANFTGVDTRSKLYGVNGSNEAELDAIATSAAGIGSYLLGVAAEVVDYDTDSGTDFTGAIGVMAGSTTGPKPILADTDGTIFTKVQGTYSALINGVTLDDSPTSSTSASYAIDDKRKISFLISYDETEVGNEVSGTFTLEVSPDDSIWIDYDIILDQNGTNAPQGSLDFTVDDEDVCYLPSDFTAGYIRATFAGTNTDADDTITVTVWICCQD